VRAPLRGRERPAHAGGGHLFAIASEPIDRAGSVEVPEGPFVAVDRTLRVLRGPLRAGGLTSAAVSGGRP
jgi:hypothetical protein